MTDFRNDCKDMEAHKLVILSVLSAKREVNIEGFYDEDFDWSGVFCTALSEMYEIKEAISSAQMSYNLSTIVDTAISILESAVAVKGSHEKYIRSIPSRIGKNIFMNWEEYK